MEIRGVVPNSIEYKRIRNKIYEELRTAKYDAKAAQENQFDGAVQANFESFYNLVIVVPEEPSSYELINILNYFHFPYNVEEDNHFKRQLAQEFGFSKDDQYPMLIINSSSKDMPHGETSSKDAILAHLFNHKLIGNYKSHSAYES